MLHNNFNNASRSLTVNGWFLAVHRQDGQVVLDVAADGACVLIALVADARDRIARAEYDPHVADPEGGSGFDALACVVEHARAERTTLARERERPLLAAQPGHAEVRMPAERDRHGDVGDRRDRRVDIQPGAADLEDDADAVRERKRVAALVTQLGDAAIKRPFARHPVDGVAVGVAVDARKGV